MTATAMGRNVIPGSADCDDVDPHATAIAFEPCRVEDALPPELLPGTFDMAADFIKAIVAPDFHGNYTPYIIRDLNAFVALGRYADAFALLSTVLGGRRPAGWRGGPRSSGGTPAYRTISAICRTPGSVPSSRTLSDRC